MVNTVNIGSVNTERQDDLQKVDKDVRGVFFSDSDDHSQGQNSKKQESEKQLSAYPDNVDEVQDQSYSIVERSFQAAKEIKNIADSMNIASSMYKSKDGTSVDPISFAQGDTLGPAQPATLSYTSSAEEVAKNLNRCVIM